jgi:hypothetical protein
MPAAAACQDIATAVITPWTASCRFLGCGGRRWLAPSRRAQIAGEVGLHERAAGGTFDEEAPLRRVKRSSAGEVVEVQDSRVRSGLTDGDREGLDVPLPWCVDDRWCVGDDARVASERARDDVHVDSPLF